MTFVRDASSFDESEKCRQDPDPRYMARFRKFCLKQAWNISFNMFSAPSVIPCSGHHVTQYMESYFPNIPISVPSFPDLGCGHMSVPAIAHGLNLSQEVDL